jgi:hypothetical protein
VHNRFARGAELASEPEEAIEFLEILRARQRWYAVLDVSLDEIAGRVKGREISRTRYLIAALGIERWEMKAKPLSELVGR